MGMVGPRVGSGRVGSDFLSAIAGRVGSGRVNVSPGRVGSKKSDPWTTLVRMQRWELSVALPAPKKWGSEQFFFTGEQ